MAIDRSIIGTTFPAFDVNVEEGQLRFFAKAIGQTDPIYIDLEAANAAGHPGLPVPPTFFFSLTRQQPDTLLSDLNIDLRAVLHGEQCFDYHAMAYAGDRLTLAGSVSDTYEKKGGALQFIVRTTRITRNGELVADLTSSLVVRSLK